MKPVLLAAAMFVLPIRAAAGSAEGQSYRTGCVYEGRAAAERAADATTACA